MTRFSLALILLFLAPSAWAESGFATQTWGPAHCDPAHPCGGVGTLNGDGTMRAWITSTTASCEPGWTIVMQEPWGPKCAWVLKEPIYK